MHFIQAGCRRIGLLQGFKQGVGRDVVLLAILGFRLAILQRFSSSRLVLVVRVVFLMLDPQALRLLHKRTLLSLIQQSTNVNNEI